MKKIISVYILLLIIFISGCQSTEKVNKNTKEETAPVSKEEAIPTIRGPKRTVAVAKFDAIGAFTAKYGNWDIGGGLSAMLVTGLQKSDRFIVIERANLDQILTEQQLKGKKLTNQETGPKLGELTGVQFLIFGSVTEFGTAKKGRGFGIGLAGGSIPFTTGLSRQSKKGSVAIDIRVVDTTTGRIVDTCTVREKFKSSKWDVTGGYKGIQLGTNKFHKTPLGEATRSAINKAIIFIAENANKTKWSGNVVDFEDDNTIFINAGSIAGVKIGDKFNVARITKIFTDPKTGEVIGKRKKVIGNMQIEVVEEKMSYGIYYSESDIVPKREDLVIMLE